MEQDFTNREIKHYFDEIQKSLIRIENQVIKTNGRVTVLEMWKETMMAKLSMVVVGVGILWVGVKELFFN